MNNYDLTPIYNLMQSATERLSVLIHQPDEDIAPKICTGCGTLDSEPIKNPFFGYCPDSNYIDIKEYWRKSKYSG